MSRSENQIIRINNKLESPNIPDLPNIHQIVLPTPWRGSTVQVYLIDDDPLTLIDTGVNWPPSYTALETAFNQLGVGLQQVRRIIATHFHSDHIGQAQTLREQGCQLEVLAHESEISSIEGFFSSHLRKREVRSELYREYGMSDEIIKKQSLIEQKWIQHNPPLLKETTVDVGLKDGDTVAFNHMELKVLHTPGHTQGHISLWDEKNGTLFSGDHIMGSDVPFTENYYLEQDPDPDDPLKRKPRFQGLQKYLKSLPRLQALPIREILPGHGSIIVRPQWAIDRSLRFYRIRIKRVEEILRTMTGSGRKVTAWDMWDTLFRTFDYGGILRRRMTMLIGIIDILEMEGSCQSSRREDGVLEHQYIDDCG